MGGVGVSCDQQQNLESKTKIHCHWLKFDCKYEVGIKTSKWILKKSPLGSKCTTVAYKYRRKTGIIIYSIF